jgi:large subunit ribosomal protein L29
MKVSELRKKSKEELMGTITDLKNRIDEIRFASAEKKTKNVKEAQLLRKDVARIKTILKETI